MSLYKKMVTKAGKINFFKDSKALKPEMVAELPAIIKNLDAGDSIEIADNHIVPEQIEVPKEDRRVSVISGEPATKQRHLNGKNYWVTKEEMSLSLGKLAQAVREREDESEL